MENWAPTVTVTVDTVPSGDSVETDSTLSCAWSAVDEDYEALLGADKDKLVVVYCGFTACGRSHNAALWARRKGYKNVKRYPGGIYAWKGMGLPTVAAE